MKYNGIYRKIERFAGSKLGLRECFVTVADNRSAVRAANRPEKTADAETAPVTEGPTAA